jgi:GMP synthase-like glutamine amidotransferase
MKKNIAFVDPYLRSPSIHCFNEIIDQFKLSMSYHMPAVMGLESLSHSQDRTDAYFVVGSASNITDPLDWHQPLADFLVSELRKGKPIIACCFGHQLMCHALGSKVGYASADEQKISGVRGIIIHHDFWNFKSQENFTLPITHKQVVRDLAPGLTAVGLGLENDIVIHETLPLLTTQAHPEASHHFCTREIGITDVAELKMARRDGTKFLERFFKYHRLI